MLFNFKLTPHFTKTRQNQWINFIESFVWAFADTLIIALAYGIHYRFDQFQQFLVKTVMKNENFMTQEMWRKLRVDFIQLIELVYFVDSWISILTFVSLGHNMFIIVLKVYNALK